MRGILQHEYGVDLNKVTWVCNDDGHLAEYSDPPNVERTPPDAKKVDQMLLDGELDGAILGAEVPNEPRVAHLIPNPKEAALAWYRKYNTVPVNHLFCVDKDLADARPDVVREIFRMLKESKAAMPPSPDGIDFHPFGVEALRKPLEMIMQYSVEQKIIPRAFTVDELFDDVTRKLCLHNRDPLSRDGRSGVRHETETASSQSHHHQCGGDGRVLPRRSRYGDRADDGGATHQTQGLSGRRRLRHRRHDAVHIAEKDMGTGFRTGHVVNPVDRGHIAFRTDDIAAFKKRLDEKGIRYSDYGGWAMSGWHQIFFYDPDGNVIEVHQAPA